MKLNLVDKIPNCDKEKCFKRINDFYYELNSCVKLSSVDEVCAFEIENEGYKNKFECCEEVKLIFSDTPEELLSAKVGTKHQYILTDSGTNQFILIIQEINAAEKNIVALKGNRDFSILIPGEVELECIIDYDKLPDMDKLGNAGFEIFPSFHETHVDVIEKGKNSLCLKFSGGFHPLVTEISMTGIFKVETNMENDAEPLDYFAQECQVGEVLIYTPENHFIVKISNNYEVWKPEGWYEGITPSQLEKIRQNPYDIIKEPHRNEYTLYCRGISFDFEKRKDSR